MTQPQADIQEPTADVVLEGDGSATFALPDTAAPTDAPAVTTETQPAEPTAPVAEPPLELPQELRPTAQPQPGFSTADQQELAQLRTQRAEFEQGRQTQQEAEELRQLERQYIEQDGVDEATAKWAANKVRAERQRSAAAVSDTEALSQFQVRRQNAAERIGREKGVAPSALMSANDTPEMITMADNIVYMAQQNKRIETLERGRIPEQHLAGGGTAQSVTSDNIDALYVQWDNAHPGQLNNPYAERYQRFLNGP